MAILFRSQYVNTDTCPWRAIDQYTKTHVRGFFDTDFHDVSWHFATHKAVKLSGF